MPLRPCIHLLSFLMAAVVAGCGPLPALPAAPATAPADDGATVPVGLALRQEVPRDAPFARTPFCHVDLVVGSRIVGFYNTFARRKPADRITRAFEGRFREYDWMAAHRPYYVDADAARRAVVKGEPVAISTTWIGARVTPDVAARLVRALDARRDAPALYRLLERNCATRLADILVDGGVFPVCAGHAGLDRPALLARRFAEYAAPGTAVMARGWFTFTPDGGVRMDAP